MSVQADIAQSAGWHAYEQKALTFTVTDDADVAVDLSAKTLRWLLLRGATQLLEKTTVSGIAVSGTDHDIVTVTIDAPDDYDGIDPGVYRHELWDVTDELLLAFGDCWLLQGTAPDA